MHFQRRASKSFLNFPPFSFTFTDVTHRYQKQQFASNITTISTFLSEKSGDKINTKAGNAVNLTENKKPS
jgi:hypothetical protein